MASTSVTVRMDEDLKKQAEILYDDMGLNMTTAITIFTKAVVRLGKIPFEIAADPFYTEIDQYTRRLIKHGHITRSCFLLNDLTYDTARYA
ncbi:MAG: type II toxin-antitoxin system RelB/DinJ family antitoxin [Clostridiales bacterium]|jgi:DNA-damage-inducible protein J|nr:type II toxin-antitoxin system RelB/DinJ family antitoxin [Clostridiales bacterium]